MFQEMSLILAAIMVRLYIDHTGPESIAQNTIEFYLSVENNYGY